jgi:hypothetical protein
MNFIKSPLGFKITTRSPFCSFALPALLNVLRTLLWLLVLTSQTAFFFAIWPYFSVVLAGLWEERGTFNLWRNRDDLAKSPT